MSYGVFSDHMSRVWVASEGGERGN